MQVWPGHVSDEADGADHDVLVHGLPDRDADRGQVGVPSLGVILVLDDNLVAVGAVVPGEGDTGLADGGDDERVSGREADL